jgi:hypothetical protein
LREHDPNSNATNAQEAGEPPGVVVLEVIVQRVEPTLDSLSLWPSHADDESRLRDGATDLHLRCTIENRLNINR